MPNPPPVGTTPDETLARLSRELRAYLGGIAADLRADGLAAAPYGLVNLANFLAWHAPKFDSALTGEPFTIAELAAELREAALPLCAKGSNRLPASLPLLARINRLEADCANLRECLANRKGEPV